MPDQAVNARLNDILILVYRSLLQYTTECWPWTDVDDDSEHVAIEGLAAEQKKLVGQLAELLDERGVVVDLGTYPDWSGLHYVSLDSLLEQLIADESAMIEAIERQLADLALDRDASGLVSEILTAERRHVSKLRDIAAARQKQPVPA